MSEKTLDVGMDKPLQGSIGDVVDSCLNVDGSGRQLLPMVGQKVDRRVYPKLALALGEKLNFNSISKVDIKTLPTDATAVTADNRYLFGSDEGDLYRLDTQTGVVTLLLSMSGYSASITISDDGQRIVFRTKGHYSGSVTGETNYEIAVSTDFGATFTKKSYTCHTHGNYVSSGVYIDGDTIYFFSLNASKTVLLYQSTNFGQTWTMRTIGTSSYPKNAWPTVLLHTEADGRMYAQVHPTTSDYYGIVTSSDDGASWAYADLESAGSVLPFRMRTLAFDAVDPSVRLGWHLVSEDYYYSNDGGVNWSLLPLPLESDQVRMVFTREHKVYALDIYGYGYMTTNWGQQWVELGALTETGAEENKTAGVAMYNFVGEGQFTYKVGGGSPSTLDGYKTAVLDVSAKLPIYGRPDINKVIADEVH